MDPHPGGGHSRLRLSVSSALHAHRILETIRGHVLDAAKAFPDLNVFVQLLWSDPEREGVAWEDAIKVILKMDIGMKATGKSGLDPVSQEIADAFRCWCGSSDVDVDATPVQGLVSPIPVVALPRGTLWHFFLSHYQAKGGDQCDILCLELQRLGFKVWYDNKAQNLTSGGMKDGVARSAVFVVFLNHGTLDRKFVLFEVETALRLGKPVVLISETDGRHGAPLDDDGVFLFDLVCGPNTPESVRVRLQSQVTIPFYRRTPFGEATIAELISQSEFEAPREALSSVTLPAPVTHGTHLFLVRGVTGSRQCLELALRLERHGVTVSQEDTEGSLAALERSSAVVLFLTDHVLQDARVQAQLRSAVTLAKPLFLVYETRKAMGAPLNGDKSFDFARVCDEQAPADLNRLHHSLEGVPFLCGSERLRDATALALRTQALGVLARVRALLK